MISRPREKNGEAACGRERKIPQSQATVVAVVEAPKAIESVRFAHRLSVYPSVRPRPRAAVNLNLLPWLTNSTAYQLDEREKK